jgi:hypothetical protein
VLGFELLPLPSGTQYLVKQEIYIFIDLSNKTQGRCTHMQISEKNVPCPFQSFDGRFLFLCIFNLEL